MPVERTSATASGAFRLQLVRDAGITSAGLGAVREALGQSPPLKPLKWLDIVNIEGHTRSTSSLLVHTDKGSANLAKGFRALCLSAPERVFSWLCHIGTPPLSSRPARPLAHECQT